MKHSTKKIIDAFPVLKKLKNNQPIELDKLSKVEQTFASLLLFVEDPKNRSFDLKELYQHLDDQYLELALEVIHLFFAKDTYLIKEPTHTLITEESEYYNQARFAEYLSENGLNIDRRKLSVYISRGHVPRESLLISGNKYWEKSVCEQYLKQELKEKSKK